MPIAAMQSRVIYLFHDSGSHYKRKKTHIAVVYSGVAVSHDPALRHAPAQQMVFHNPGEPVEQQACRADQDHAEDSLPDLDWFASMISVGASKMRRSPNSRA